MSVWYLRPARFFSNGLTVTVLVWLLFYLWRPFVLGFYHDDWALLVESSNRGTPFSADRFEWVFSQMGSRPLLAFIQILLLSAFGDSPFGWHLALVFIALFVAVALNLFFNALLRLLGHEHPLAAGIAASFWLIFPWGIGSAAWPVSGAAMFALVFFALSGAALFTAWQKGENPWLLPGVLFLLSSLVYEAFYFQFIIFMLFGFFAGVHKRFGRKTLVFPLLGYLLAQIIALSWNRIYYLLEPSLSKKVYEGWLLLFVKSGVMLPLTLLRGAWEFRVPLVILVIAGGILCFTAGKRWLSRPREERMRLIALYLLCIVGIMMSVGIFAVAGYRIEGLGLFSRTTLSLNFWLVTALVLIFYMFAGLPGRLKKAGIIVVVGVAVCLAGATLLRVRDFAGAWRIQQEILAAAPVDKMAQTDDLAIIVFEGPFDYNGVILFGATWDISGAMNNRYPELRLKRTYDGLRPILWRQFTVRRDWVNIWDGNKYLQQGPPPDGSPPHWVLEGSELWLWDYAGGKFYKQDKPLKF